MGGFIKRDVARVETQAVNQKINKDIYNAFQDCCKEMGYPMNMVVEPFMQQYADGRIILNPVDIQKWKNIDSEKETFNTTINKEIYLSFKNAVKENRYFVKYVITAFMELFVKKEIVLEYTAVEEINEQSPVRLNLQEEETVAGIVFWRCPECGEKFEAVAENWCVKQYTENSKQIIVCRENCGHV